MAVLRDDAPDPAAPHVGRARWLAVADDLLRAVRPYASPGHALLTLPGPVSASGRWSDGLEGYARTFLLAAFRVAGEGGADPDGLLERYAAGLAAGTDPASPERWPRMTERRQAVVEAASVAVALAETRPWLWDRLDDGVRARVVDWFADIVGTAGYRNNWLWFQDVVEAFLADVGGPWSQDDLDRNDALREDLYVGDGWYSDGRGRDGERQTFDHYAGWAWHLYPLLHARIRRRPLEQVHAERLHAYLTQARQLVGAAGAPLLQGRSTTYRFAVLAPFWAGALAGATPLRPAETRTLAAGVLEHFLEAGAVDEHGLLPIGWHRAYPRLRQLYSGGASPYWASKAFLGLLLPADDAVWTAPAEPEPAPATGAQVAALPVPGWLVVRTPADGLVRVLNHGSDRMLEPRVAARADDPAYRRLGYSTATSPQLSRDAVAAPLESHTALLDRADAPSHRDGIQRIHLGGTCAVSRSRVHWLDTPGAPGAGDDAGWAGLRRGPQVTTASVVHGVHELRLAWWHPAVDDPVAHPDADAAWPADPGPWRVHVGGWALAGAGRDEVRVEDGPDRVVLHRADGTVSAVRAVRGLDEAGATWRDGADPFARWSATPWLRSSAPVASGAVVAALVVLAGGAGDDVDLDAVASVDVGDGEVAVRWRDGRRDVVPAAHVVATADGVHP
ncbi:DUF2264 domain-containing protein [Cellulomonas sp.]|uniref:DUF2264 domain-containing protein n=1 Tax=Cellulomonas sp. TaxID=40001 RepID=UPI002810DCFB|nr:DUF2264 domain-containing protein [Cellulomonas sp.]